jgi:hypothetical protein
MTLLKSRGGERGSIDLALQAADPYTAELTTAES